MRLRPQGANKIRVRATEYDVVVWEEGRTWTAHAPSITGVYGLGATREEAKEDLTEAANLLFNVMAKAKEPFPPRGGLAGKKAMGPGQSRPLRRRQRVAGQ